MTTSAAGSRPTEGGSGKSIATWQRELTRLFAAMAKGILIAAMDFSNVAADEYNDWCDAEHIP
jgi:hypothetical protein